jgi:hypothetical protein
MATPINTDDAAENLAVFNRMALNNLGYDKGLLDRRRKCRLE